MALLHVVLFCWSVCTLTAEKGIPKTFHLQLSGPIKDGVSAVYRDSEPAVDPPPGDGQVPPGPDGPPSVALAPAPAPAPGSAPQLLVAAKRSDFDGLPQDTSPQRPGGFPVVPGYQCSCKSSTPADGCRAKFACDCSCLEATPRIPPPDEGNHTTNIVCVHKLGENRTFESDFAFLSDLEKTTVVIRGERIGPFDCPLGTLTPFRISADVYSYYLTRCQKFGYDLIQPTDQAGDPKDLTFREWGAFAVGQGLPARYVVKGTFAIRVPDRNIGRECIPPKQPTTANVILPTTTPNINETEVDPPINSTSEYNGTEVVYVACVHKIGERLEAVEDWFWSSLDRNTHGNWKMFKCGTGTVDAFRVSASVYNTLLAKCQAMGYATAQPAKTLHFKLYFPFQVGPPEAGVFTEHYSHDMNEEWRLVAEQVIGHCEIQQEVTPVVCTTTKGGKVEYTWLSDFNETKNAADVTGKWLKYTCTWGEFRAFRISVNSYTYLTKKCKAKGYESVQTIEVVENVNVLFPFVAGRSFASHYRLKNGSLVIADSIFYPEELISLHCTLTTEIVTEGKCNGSRQIYAKGGPPPSCEASCDNLFPNVCLLPPVAGCFCEPGLVKWNGICIDSSDCPSKTTGSGAEKTVPPTPPPPVTEDPTKLCSEPGEVHQTCGTACQASCADPNPTCSKICSIGCFCESGLVRDVRGKCILRDKCPTITTTAVPLTTPKPTEPPTTPTKPTCVATSSINTTGICDKLEPGKSVSRACMSACYARDRGHYRRSECPIGGSGTCNCIYDPCRNGQMDVVFLIDSSGSLKAGGFKQERDFIADFVSKMDIGYNESRVGLVQFSDSSRIKMQLTDLQSRTSFLTTLHGLFFDAGGTNIFAAFTSATNLFNTKRPQVPQLVILVTDGVHAAKGNPNEPAQKLKNSGIIIYAIGIGAEAQKGRAAMIQYTGSESRVFMAAFSDLKNVVNIIGAEVTASVNE